ncbi:tellurite resistance TerB C-terminal domain-containing protein [Ancylomarina sp. YFZ004]
MVLPSFSGSIKLVLFFVFTVNSINAQASDHYVTTSELNMRSGAGSSFKSIEVLTKGDTVKLIEVINSDWVKIQKKDKIGYSSKQYLEVIKIDEITKTEESDTFPSLLFWIVFFAVSTVGLTVRGNKYRSKSFTSFLSLFFGFLGFQRFYLGQKSQGVFSILFCWTFIPLIIGLFETFKFSLMSEVVFNNKYNLGKFRNKMEFEETKKQKIKPNIIEKHYTQQEVKQDSKTINKKNIQSVVSESSSKKLYSDVQVDLPANKSESVDSSIIDVNMVDYDLTVEKSNHNNEVALEPPYWEPTYVYSYNEIKSASKSQKIFFFYLKNQFLNYIYVDIQGYTNYGFILYFDLLREFENHQDIKLLEEQFKFLGQICPKTKSYSLISLQDLLRKRTDSYSEELLNNLQEPNFQFENGYSDYNPDLYKLGNQFKEKLGLTKQEIDLLNKFYNPSNVFTSIEGCAIVVINVYLAVFKELNIQLSGIGSDIDLELDKIFDKVCDIENLTFSDYYKGQKPYWAIKRFHEVIFIAYYKAIENLVRENYGHKRKLSFEKYHPYTKSTSYIDETIGNLIQDLIADKIQGLNEPDLDTQIALNAQNVNRWKIEFTVLKDDFKKEKQEQFVNAIITLEEANQENPNIENIFFDASKFIAKFDKVESLRYYAKYIYYDLKSKKVDSKELTKSVQKILFNTEEQFNDFKKIISSLISTNDLQLALDEIAKIYIQKRKKIILDKSEIIDVERKHDGTVELLNEYLESEEEDVVVENKLPDVESKLVPHTGIANSIFIPEISVDKVQEQLVRNIVANSFEIHQDEVDKFASENGMFKNQLIDSINEACEECLDGEVLIEEDDENYIIEASYFKEIAL